MFVLLWLLFFSAPLKDEKIHAVKDAFDFFSWLFSLFFLFRGEMLLGTAF